jgi:MoxR-like ATPase
MDEIVRDLENREGYRPAKPVQVPPALGIQTHDPSGYLPDPGLVDAIRVALHLRKPLLLTGEPGTGKTDLAYFLNWKLGHAGRPLIFTAKSDSAGRDLFYTYDTVGRFRAKESVPDANFLTFNALGLAILWANPKEITTRLPAGFEHPGEPQQSVVLIDEVDKAPRDFPNDILDEMDRMKFSVKEFPGANFETPQGMEPIVVITSNLEKNLPGPFLRRCVFYHIPFPEKRLADIACARIASFANADSGKDSALLQSAIELFLELRDPELDLQKKPATGELLDWLLYLVRRGARFDTPLWKQSDLVTQSISALIKDQQDSTTAGEHAKEWLAKPRK